MKSSTASFAPVVTCEYNAVLELVEMPETKFLTIRNVEERVAREFAAGASIRGITQAEYLKKLLLLRFFASAHLADVPGTTDEDDIRNYRALRERFLDMDLEDMSA